MPLDYGIIPKNMWNVIRTWFFVKNVVAFLISMAYNSRTNSHSACLITSFTVVSRTLVRTDISSNCWTVKILSVQSSNLGPVENTQIIYKDPILLCLLGKNDNKLWLNWSRIFSGNVQASFHFWSLKTMKIYARLVLKILYFLSKGINF